mgnify:CR=1 FL=1
MIHLIRNNAYGITIGRLLYLMRHKCVYLQTKHKNDIEDALFVLLLSIRLDYTGKAAV